MGKRRRHRKHGLRPEEVSPERVNRALAVLDRVRSMIGTTVRKVPTTTAGVAAGSAKLEAARPIDRASATPYDPQATVTADAARDVGGTPVVKASLHAAESPVVPSTYSPALRVPGAFWDARLWAEPTPQQVTERVRWPNLDLRVGNALYWLPGEHPVDRRGQRHTLTEWAKLIGVKKAVMNEWFIKRRSLIASAAATPASAPKPPQLAVRPLTYVPTPKPRQPEARTDRGRSVGAWLKLVSSNRSASDDARERSRADPNFGYGSAGK